MNWWTLQQLKFKNPQTRRQAVEKLALLSVEEAVSGLISALEDDAAEVRVAAVQGLGREAFGQSVSCLRPVPSGRTRKRFRSRLKTMRDPSGDHAGWLSRSPPEQSSE